MLYFLASGVIPQANVSSKKAYCDRVVFCIIFILIKSDPFDRNIEETSDFL